MKLLNSILSAFVLAAFLLVPALANCQTPAAPATGSLWSASGYYDLKSKLTSTIVSYKIKTFTNLFGNPKLSVDFSAFGGTITTTQAPIGGFILGKSYGVASCVSITGGVGWSLSSGKPNSAGLAIGLTAQF